MVGDVVVTQRERVAVLAQGGGGFGVAEALLGLQELAVGDRDCRDGVPEPVQADLGMAVRGGEVVEPASEGAAAQPLAMVGVGGEQPRTDRSVRRQPALARRSRCRATARRCPRRR